MIFEHFIGHLRFANADNPEVAADKLIARWQQKGEASVLHFMYYASLELARKDNAYREALLLADLILVDGIGMQTYFKGLLGRHIANLNGTDLSPLLIEKLLHRDIPICFFGTTPELISACNNVLNEKYDRRVLHYFQDGFSELNWDQVPDGSALFVGMGTPRQENWVKDNIRIIQLKKLLVLTVGGYFDFLSGFYVRAPQWVRSLKLEWAWRTMLHPGRHYQKRLRDTTILLRPGQDKRRGLADKVRIVDL